MTARELSILAAKIFAAHHAAARPPLPRPEARQQGELIDQLITGGGHDPAAVEAALTRWRDRRRKGEHVTRSTLEYILEDIELADARAAAFIRDDTDVALLCPGCCGYHRPADPCQGTPAPAAP